MKIIRNIVGACMLIMGEHLCAGSAMTGVYWGAFDPPTAAHEAIINQVLVLPETEELIIVVNNHSYKDYTLSIEERFNLMKKIVGDREVLILVQEDSCLLNFENLVKIARHPLCAISGYDAYQNWIQRSSPEDRSKYKAIAVIPRGSSEPVLQDKHAFLLEIEGCYRNLSSTMVRDLLSRRRPAKWTVKTASPQ